MRIFISYAGVAGSSAPGRQPGGGKNQKRERHPSQIDKRVFSCGKGSENGSPSSWDTAKPDGKFGGGLDRRFQPFGNFGQVVGGIMIMSTTIFSKVL